MLPTGLPPSSVNRPKLLKRRTKYLVSHYRLSNFSISHLWRLTVLVFVFLLIYSSSRVFQINQIDCYLGQEICPSEILASIDNIKGSNFMLINQKEISSRLQRSFPVNQVNLNFKLFNRLQVSITPNPSPIEIGVISVKDLPTLSMDISLVASQSSEWVKPSSDLHLILTTASASSFSLWENGQMTPSSTTVSTIKYILDQKPSETIVKSLYSLIKLVEKYLTSTTITILGDRVFLSQHGQPDIIVSVPFDETWVGESIRSLPYLLTLKTDAKVIDLRFKNPILR